ncbi:MAG: DUF3164 family protein [Alistipes sp.]
MGNVIPIKYVSKYNRQSDKTVRRIFDRYVKTRKMLEKVMDDTLADFDAIRFFRENSGAKAEGAKGNMTTRSFDGSIQVELRAQYDIILDDRIVQAREMMLGYVNTLLSDVTNEEARSVLCPIVTDAFRANRSGSLSLSRISSLLHLEVKADIWRAARQLIIDSMQGSRGKSYIRVSRRPDRQHNYRAITLDIADCWSIEQPSDDEEKE